MKKARKLAKVFTSIFTDEIADIGVVCINKEVNYEKNILRNEPFYKKFLRSKRKEEYITNDYMKTISEAYKPYGDKAKQFSEYLSLFPDLDNRSQISLGIDNFINSLAIKG